MKEKVSFSVFIIVGLLAMPVFADELQWNGKWADPAEILPASPDESHARYYIAPQPDTPTASRLHADRQTPERQG